MAITWVDWTHPVKGGMIKKDPKLEGGRKVKIDLEEDFYGSLCHKDSINAFF